MSIVKVQGNASGTGIFTVASPNSNTDRTLTLPDSSGTVATAESTLAQFNASGSAPVYAARAWVNFNGTGTVAIRASGNVSSITDNGTGDYTVNFSTAMPDANYSVGHAFQIPSWADYTMNLNSMNTGTLQVVFGRNTIPNAVDMGVVTLSVFR